MNKVVGLAVLALAATTLAACGSGGGGSTRTIQVDYHHDEFAGSFLGFYPHTVTVNPGMTLKFHQTWTGEPHSVTLGAKVTALVAPILGLLHDHYNGATLPDAPPPEAQPFIDQLPDFFSGENGGLDQRAAQPCFLAKGATIPSDKAKGCSPKPQPAFDGTQTLYSSGFIPFEGARGNTFEMKIAPKTKPGTYFYYCDVHGPPMFGEITVAAGRTPDSQAAMNRRGKTEADRIAKPLLAAYHREVAGKSGVKGNIAGSGDDSTEQVDGIVNEFTPRTIQTTIGKPVTWTFIGQHTISFNVPPYAPLFTTAKNGTVNFSGKLDSPAGGWPGRTPPADDHGDGPPPPPVRIDAGKWDGSGGLHSTGVEWVTGDSYSVTFTKKGTYPYACLIHPGMIAKVVVA